MIMKSFFKAVVDRPKVFIAAFLALFLVCLVCRQFVLVNYDIIKYLPHNSASTLALEIMDEEFGSGIPNTRVMVQDVTIPQALEYKEELLQVDGVIDVIWLDNHEDITKPFEIIDPELADSYYKNNMALFFITIENENITGTVSAIREVIGDSNYMTGSDVSLAQAMSSGKKEIGQITLLAVIFVLLALIITTRAWVEPLIVLAGLGIAIVINAGSNIIFGEISFITNAAGNVLQLAISLDYSVFLLHRFEECRMLNTDVKKAMIQALHKSSRSILSSGVTTVVGFLALVLMQFRIGPDLGLALAKGIGISLLSVFFLLPSLILVSHKLIDKTHHRPFVPNFRSLGNFVRKAMIPLVCLFILIIVPAYFASNSNDFYYGASYIFDEQTKVGADNIEIENVFGKNDTYALLVPKGHTATEKQLSGDLKSLSETTGIISFVDSVGIEIPEEYLDDEVLTKLVSDQHTRMLISLDTDYEGDRTFALVENIREIAEMHYSSNYHLAGQGVSAYDLMNSITSDMITVNLIAIGAVFLVLLLTMRSFSLPFILTMSIEVAILINLAIPYFSGSRIFYTAYLIISSVQLGATVDYAILFTERYKEFRQAVNKKQSVVNTVSAVTISILTSATVLTIVGFLLGYISSHGVLSQLGYFLGRGTLYSLAVVLFVLPGLLYVFDGWISRTTRKTNLKAEEKGGYHYENFEDNPDTSIVTDPDNNFGNDYIRSR
jgi:hypothetical protein